MTVSLTSSPQIAASLLRIVDRLQAEFPTMPPVTVVRCVEAARPAARPLVADRHAYAERVESLARTDLVTMRLVSSERIAS
jgi:hypothetical protein